MSEYLFAVHKGKLGKHVRRRLAECAKAVGATFVYANLPGIGWQSWCAAPNMGVPFDGERALRYYEACVARGITIYDERMN